MKIKVTQVFIVDDSPLQRSILRIALRPHQLVVRSFDDPRDWLKALRHEPLSLTFMDLNMPTLNGRAAVQEASRLYGNSGYVVLYSSDTPYSSHESLQRDGFFDSLSKPFGEKELDVLLEKFEFNNHEYLPSN